MYAATSFELFTSGLGTGAFQVLLLRLTQKRFSATQYALFSSLFALPRLLAGPISGFVVDAIGWRTFFLSTLGMGIPGLVMLHRFVPLGMREPSFDVDETMSEGKGLAPIARGALVTGGLLGAVLSGVFALGMTTLLQALKTMRAEPAAGFDLAAALAVLSRPEGVADWVQLVGIFAFAVIGGLFTAATIAARRRL